MRTTSAASKKLHVAGSAWLGALELAKPLENGLASTLAQRYSIMKSSDTVAQTSCFPFAVIAMLLRNLRSGDCFE